MRVTQAQLPCLSPSADCPPLSLRLNKLPLAHLLPRPAIPTRYDVQRDACRATQSGLGAALKERLLPALDLWLGVYEHCKVGGSKGNGVLDVDLLPLCFHTCTRNAVSPSCQHHWWTGCQWR